MGQIVIDIEGNDLPDVARNFTVKNGSKLFCHGTVTKTIFEHVAHLGTFTHWDARIVVNDIKYLWVDKNSDGNAVINLLSHMLKLGAFISNIEQDDDVR